MRNTYRLLAMKTFCLSFLSLFFARTSANAQMGAGTNLSYDGNDDYLTISPGVVAGLTGNYTIETYVYWRGGLSFQRIFDFGNDQNNWIVLTPATPSGQPRYGINVGGGFQFIDGASLFPVNAWTHIAITYNNSTQVATIYINGVADGTGTITSHPSDLGSTVNNWLGKSEFSDPYFNGEIEEMRISNSIRYTATFTPPQMQFTSDANTVALYHFNEGSGQTTADASGNGYNGVRGATTATESSDPSWVVNSVLPVRLTSFNAIADRTTQTVTAQWSASLDRTGEFVVERSANGSDFTPAGTVSANSGSSSYTLRDAHPLPGRSYYRLKATETGSAPVYSKVVAVSFSNSGELVVYPNPVKGSVISVELSQPVSGDVTISFTNAAGVQVQSQKMNVTSRKDFQVNRTSALAAGTYLLEVRTGSDKQSKMIIVQ